MNDLAQAAARRVVEFVAYLLDSLRGEINAWVQGGDTTLMVFLAVIALALLVMVVVPGRRRY
jgi:hypothetical protein